jgi:HD-like signal output (HDOD) protein/DNA-binding response OmpR family regulator
MLRVLTLVVTKSIADNLGILLSRSAIKRIASLPNYSSFLKTVQYQPNAIIVEISGTSLDQIRLLQLINRHESTAHTPVIAFGPEVNENIEKSIINYGADVYLKLPLDYKDLFGKLNELLKKHDQEEKNEIGVDVNQMMYDDMQKVLDPSVPFNLRLDIMEKHIGELMAFPATVASVISLTSDDKSSAGQLGRVIESDSAVTAALLKMSNSIAFSARGRKIASIKEAIVRVGFDQTKKAVISMSVMGSASETNYQTAFSHTEFWYHSLAVAVIAEMIAKKCRKVAPEEAYVFGLLHELGVLLHNEYLNTLFLELVDKSTENGLPFSQYQLENYKISHFDLSARLFEKWNLSESFVDAAKALNNPVISAAELETSPLALIIKVADTIAHSLAIGRAADSCVYAIDQDLLRSLGLGFGLSGNEVDNIKRSVDMYSEIITKDGGAKPAGRSILKHSDEIALFCFNPGTHGINPVIEYLKRQGYQWKEFKEEEQLLEALAENGQAVVVIPYFTEAQKDLIAKCKEYRLLIFDDLDILQGDSGESSHIITRFPVDLRNTDMAIHALSLGHFDKGKLASSKALMPLGILAENSKKNGLIAISSTQFGKAIQDYMIKNLGYDTVEVVDEGSKAVNMANTAPHEVDIFILDHALPGIDTMEVIKSVRLQSRHKRCLYVVFGTEKTLTQIAQEKYKKMGVKHCIVGASARDIGRDILKIAKELTDK